MSGTSWNGGTTLPRVSCLLGNLSGFVHKGDERVFSSKRGPAFQIFTRLIFAIALSTKVGDMAGPIVKVEGGHPML